MVVVQVHPKLEVAQAPGQSAVDRGEGVGSGRRGGHAQVDRHGRTDVAPGRGRLAKRRQCDDRRDRR
jgi:hypothetical protein